MNKKLIMVLLSTLMILAVFQAGADEAKTPLTVKPTKIDGNLVTLDGEEADWEDLGVGETTLTLTKNGGSDTHGALVRMAYNDTHLALAFIVIDGNEINISSHKLSPAVGVEWAIDADAGPHMGTEDGVSTGKVDIWHWELEQPAGYVHRNEGTTSGDGINNLDDEWASTTTERYDDAKENSLMGAYGYIADEGEWIFEIIRPLQTNDANDTQFEDNASYKLALAYWDPTETTDGWTPSGHFTSIAEHEWITVTFGNPASDNAKSPGFELFVAFSALVALPVILRKRN